MSHIHRANRSHLTILLALSATLVAVILVANGKSDGPPSGDRLNGTGAPPNAGSPVPGDGSPTKPIATLEQRLSELSNQELADLAKGGKTPETLRGLDRNSDAELSDLLLQELARRIESKTPDQPSTKATPADPVGATESPTPTETVTPDEQTRRIVKATSIELEDVSAVAVAGQPAGAGRITLKYAAGRGPTVFPDQRLNLTSSESRVRYACFRIQYQEGDDHRWQVDKLEASFLVRGTDPLQLHLAAGELDVLADHRLEIHRDLSQLQSLKSEWWKAFSKAPKDLAPEQRQLHDALLDILSRRHRLPSPWPRVKTATSSERSVLETQFERAVGMLFGIESVKLAMQDDVTLNETTRFEKADQPLPPRRQLRSVVVPSFHEIPIEPIAMRVPQECFYLRTRNVDNYRYFRTFLTEWGGNLNDIVAAGTLDRDIRRRIESQLALDSDRITTERMGGLISDMALIGCDPLFEDGAAMGVLFESSYNHALADELKRHRATVLSNFPDVTERRLVVNGHVVSILASDDMRVRSFYAIDGSYHLITNSEYLLTRFFHAGDGIRRLGDLKEFRCARSKTESIGNQVAWLYLSDPFFQHLISPRYRIEMTRRARARRELQQLELGARLARVEELSADSVAGLIDANLLPKNFQQRPDGSKPLWEDGQIRDSVRGLRGSFLPVPDLAVDKVTRSEINAYNNFIAEYNREWGRIDPVTVVMSRPNRPSDSTFDSVRLNIVVTPYARRKYARLSNHLAEPSKTQLSTDDRDLLSVQAAVRLGPSHPSHLLAIGLRDDEAPFVIEDGKIKLLDRDDGSSFAKSHAYAAITPASTEVLRMLASVLLDVDTAPEAPKHTPSRSRPISAPVPPPSGVPLAAQAFYYFAWGVRNMPSESIAALRYVDLVKTRDNLTIVSESETIREATFEKIARIGVDRPNKIIMRMKSLSGSEVEPYIQAYTYLDSRRASAANARFLSEWTDWLALPPDRSRKTIESLLGAKLTCPLGGEFEPESVDRGVDWKSTAWAGESLYEISRPPETWRFGFLDWMHQLDLRFDLDRSTLRAQADLTIRTTPNSEIPERQELAKSD